MARKSFSVLIIIILGLVFYSNSFLNGFVWDDDILIIKNELIRDAKNWQEIISSELHPLSRTNYYRPVQVFSYMLDYRIWKLNPFGYHLTNFLLHIMNAILVYLLIMNIMPQATGYRLQAKSLQLGACSLERNYIPFLTSLFWVVHPVHVEAVSYISGRADLLAAFFMLSAFLLYIKGGQLKLKEVKNDFSIVYHLLSIICFEMALFSKEMSVIFPLVLISYEYCFIREENLLVRIKRLGPFICLALFYIFLRLSILNFAGGYIWAKASFYADKIPTRIFSFLKCAVIYLGLLAMPKNLYMERFMAPATRLLDPWVLAALSLSAVFLLVFRRLSLQGKRFFAPFGMLWFLIFLFPQSTFLFTILLADHFLYLPSIGVFFLCAYGLWFLHARRRYFVRVTAIVVVFFWGVATFAQNYVWRNDFTFYLWTDRFSPAGFKTRNNLANIYFLSGREDLAIEKYEQALGMSPKISTIKENIAKAENYFIEKYKDQIRLGPNYALPNYNLAYLYQRKGRLEEAVQHYKKAIEMNPKFAEALSNLGNVYERQGKFPEALTQYRQAVSVNPNFAQGYFNIGVVLANQGKLKEAREYFAKALKIKLDYHKAVEYMSQIEDMLK